MSQETLERGRPPGREAAHRAPGGPECYCGLAMKRPLTLLLLSGALACASSPSLISFPLVYKPTSKPDAAKTAALPAIPAGTQVFIAQIVDKRQVQDPNNLGISEEDNPAVPVFNAPGGQVPTEFVRNVFAKELAAMGLGVTADQAAATHTLQLQLDQFWVAEGNVYQATVLGQVWVIDRSGTTRWQGPVAGKSSRWGRSRSEDNYLEALSDATLDSAVALVATPDFRGALAAP